MGYSNNKWRKILTILMIVNLCFILFAKITRCFGAFSVTYDNTEIPITDSLINNSPYYAIFATDKLYQGTHYFWLVRSNSPIKLRVLSSGATRLTAFNTNQNGLDVFLAQGQGFIDYINNTNFTAPTDTSRYIAASGINSSWSCVITNHDITNIDNEEETLFPENITKYPEIANSLNDLETLNFDVISVNAWDWSNKDFDILFYDRNNVDTSTTDGLYPKRVITLNKNTPYYQADLTANPDKNAIFWIPIEETGLNFYIGGNYEIRLAEREPIQRWRWFS